MCVRVCKETLKQINDGGHCINSKIITGMDTHIPLFDVLTCRESKTWVFEDNRKPNLVREKTKSNEKKYITFHSII